MFKILFSPGLDLIAVWETALKYVRGVQSNLQIAIVVVFFYSKQPAAQLIDKSDVKLILGVVKYDNEYRGIVLVMQLFFIYFLTPLTSSNKQPYIQQTFVLIMFPYNPSLFHTGFLLLISHFSSN